MTDRVVGEKFEAYLCEDGLVRFDWADGATISSSEAELALEAIVALTGNVAAPTLVDIRSVSAVEREARKRFASSPATSRQALLVASPLSRTLGNFFIALSRPSMPVRLFDDETDAIAWLHDDG